MAQSFWWWRQMLVPRYLRSLMAEMSNFTAPAYRIDQDKAGQNCQLPLFPNCLTGRSRTHLYLEARYLLLKAELFPPQQHCLFVYGPQDARGENNDSRDYDFHTSCEKPCKGQCYTQQLVIQVSKRELNHLFPLLLLYIFFLLQHTVLPSSKARKAASLVV